MMIKSESPYWQIGIVLCKFTLASLVTFFSVKWMLSKLDPNDQNKKRFKQRAEQQLRKLCEQCGFKVKTKDITEHELMIASHLVVPSDISVTWKDIAGLEHIKQELFETIVLPIRHKNMFAKSKLWQAPKGVLLHGPPGCGKTLIAKATAKEAEMRFINLDVAMLTDKYYGESQKLASAVFSLAIKIEPTIIFIDEMDSFLRARNNNDHEATAMMKTQFMLMWDGLSTNANTNVIILGATNRPHDLDKAILRRMPAQFHIPLPNAKQRCEIIKLILSNEQLAVNVDCQQLAKITNGFSGSDLRELCRNACVHHLRDYVNCIESCSANKANSSVAAENALTDAPSGIFISMEDLLFSYKNMKDCKKKTSVAVSDDGNPVD